MQVLAHALFVLLLANVVTPVRAARTVCVSIEGEELNVRTNTDYKTLEIYNGTQDCCSISFTTLLVGPRWRRIHSC